MLLDKIVFLNLSVIGRSLLKKAKLNKYPESLSEMLVFLKNFKESLEDNDFDAVFLASILFNFVTSVEVRDRKTTSRVFEDIFSSLFETVATDNSYRTNPIVPNDILELDSLTQSYTWRISSDLAGNKREKADLSIGNYQISLKTLKGFIVDESKSLVDRSLNEELNIGSFSFRALFVGILSDDVLSNLSDRRGGLGSGSQIRREVLDPIKKMNKQIEFHNRLKLFLNYVYCEDVYIVLKSHLRITFYLIPNESFVSCLELLYIMDEPHFETVWYRWENNNLRIRWLKLIEYLDSYKLKYYMIDIDLHNSLSNVQLNEFIKDTSDLILYELNERIKYS